MKVIRTSKINFCQIFLAFLASTTASSLPLPSQKVWLSEYGYREIKSDILTQVAFPVFQNQNNFSNSFLSKNDTEVIVHGILTFIVFTCEAKYPIFWSLNQEMNVLSEGLMTKTLQFQSSSNGSKAMETNFRSLIYIYLELSEYYSDTEEYFPSNCFGNFEFTCHKNINSKVYSINPGITLQFNQKYDNEISVMHSLNLEERIPIVLFKKEYNTSLDYNLSYLRRDFPNFYANQHQQIILTRNYTHNLSNYEDISAKDSKLVEYKLNDHVREGAIIQILCFSNKKLYSYGTYIEIIMENGTAIRVQEETHGLNAKPDIVFSDKSKVLADNLYLLEDSSEEHMLYFFSKEIEVKLGMKQVSCYMLIWVNGKWDKVSKEMNVVPK